MKKKLRKLALRIETLRALADVELTRAVGGLDSGNARCPVVADTGAAACPTMSK